MKHKILYLFIIVLSISLIACSPSTKKESKDKEDVTPIQTSESERSASIQIDELGMAFDYPNSFEEALQIGQLFPQMSTHTPNDPVYGSISYLFYPKTPFHTLNEKLSHISDQNEQIKVLKDYSKNIKDLALVVILNKTSITPEIKKQIFSSFNQNDLLGETKDLEYYLLYNDPIDLDHVVQEDQAQYKKIHEDIKEFKNSIQIYEPITSEEKLKSKKNIGNFKTKDLNDQTVTSERFKDYKLTLINIWATDCPPCIDEMPTLESLYEDFKKDQVNVMGILSDTYIGSDTLSTAKMILDKKKVTFTTLLPDHILEQNILENISYTPTTLFVDQNGNIVGEPLVGVKSKEEYKAAISNLLKTLK